MKSLVMPMACCCVDFEQRRYKDVAEPFWNKLMAQFDEYKSTPPSAQPLQKMDGLLFMFGLATQYANKAPYSSRLEGVLTQYVAPELRSAAPFLRLR